MTGGHVSRNEKKVNKKLFLSNSNKFNILALFSDIELRISMIFFNTSIYLCIFFKKSIYLNNFILKKSFGIIKLC